MKNTALFNYCLRLGDTALIQGHRLSEWCSKAPILEEDLALTNFALDHIGRAQAFFKYAGELEAAGRTEDDLSYKRGERSFFNALLVEIPDNDFAYAVAKQLFLNTFEVLLFEKLSKSTDATLAGIASKALKESNYQRMHAADWCNRLGLGTKESAARLQQAVDSLWMFTGDLFESTDSDKSLAKEGIAVDFNSLRDAWLKAIQKDLYESEIKIPESTYMQSGSRSGVHTEYLEHILTEMQYLQRAYPDAVW